MDNPHRFLVERTQEFGPEHCFLCGRHIPLGSSERTVEHVFPKWLLRELNLWDRTVTQLNGEFLAYRNLTVPCCLTCNGRDLSAVESSVKKAYLEGFNAFKALGPRDLFIWFGKIYYGLVYKESLRPRLSDDQAGERLVPESHLQSVEFHHFLMQAAAGLVEWQPELPGPASFHFFECLDSDDAIRRFDYCDNLSIPILAIRMGRIGVVCILQDWGRSVGVQQLQILTAKKMVLHPTQFREAYARLAYMTLVSWKNEMNVIIGGGKTALVIANPPAEFTGSFVVEDYAHALASVWEVPHEDIYTDGYTFSTICGAEGLPNEAAEHEVVFTAPFGTTGLWPAHRLNIETLTEQVALISFDEHSLL